MGLNRLYSFGFAVIVLWLGVSHVVVQATGGDALKSKIPITPELANTWAEKILDNVFTSRHQPIFDQLQHPTTLRAVDAMRDNLINSHRGKPEAYIFEKLTSKDYLNALEGSIRKNKDINTIAVMVDGDKIYISGNIKNVELPLDPSDAELFKKLAMNKEVIYPHDHFGLDDSDAPLIKKAIRDTNMKDSFDGKDPAVLVVQPTAESQIVRDLEVEKQGEWKNRVDELTKNHQAALERLDRNARKNPKFSEADLQSKVAKMEEKFRRNLQTQKLEFDKTVGNQFNYKKNVKGAHVHHAEMQLLYQAKKANLGGENKVVIGVSKSLCEKCQQGIIDADDIFDFTQHDKPGQPAANIKNWEQPEGVKVTDLSEMEARLKSRTNDLDEMMATKLKSVDISGCSRRKRSLGSPCAKIDSKRFIQEYAEGDEFKKRKLAEATRMEDGLQFEGSADDVDKVKNLAKLEDVKTYQKATVASKLKQKGGARIFPALDSNISAKPAHWQTDPFANFMLWDKIKVQSGKVKTKLSQTKLAKKINNLYNSKGFSRSSSAISKSTAPIGIFLLGKSIVNGAIHKDYTSLGIIGARLGIEAVEKGAKLSSNLARVGGKFAKTSKIIGKIAGPIGIIADIGLSSYSLAKAVDRLHASDNQYDKNDAIADIVQESVDIAITTAVVVATLAFPPAGAIIAVVGIIANLALSLVVSLFKTQNEIDRIESDIPLLDFEKNEQFVSRFFDWFGTRQNDYVDDLVKTKKLNDLFVKHNLNFLKSNPQLSGIAFPARSISYSGSCRVTRRTCYLKNLWGCSQKFSSDVELARGCDQGQYCDGHSCTNWWESTGDWSYDDYRCLCDQSSNVQEGYPRLNNLVDFRQKQWIHLERAVPAEVNGAVFKCRPGHLTDQGFRTSQRSMTRDYLCDGTIALYQPNLGGKIFYFDLEDGNDWVYLNEYSSEDNIFIIQNGQKKFVAANGNDNFVLHANCTKLNGLLEGGGGVNSITLPDDLLRGSQISFKDSYLSDGTGYNNFNIQFSNINEITGRKGRTEFIKPSCDLRTVRSQGGGTNPDVVDLSVIGCTTSLTIISEGNTKVINSKPRATRSISIRPIQLVSLPGETADFECNIHLHKNMDLTVIIQDGCSNYTNLSYTSTISKISLNSTAANGRGRFNLSFDTAEVTHASSQVKVLFWEGVYGGSSYSSANFQSPGELKFIHSLDIYIGTNYRFEDLLERIGAQEFPNIFLLRGGSWKVKCGKMGDSFILYDSFLAHAHASINCPPSRKQNIIAFNEDSRGRLDINFMHGTINDGIKISGVTTLEGRKKLAESVTCGCDTEHVATSGGSFSNPDLVIIPSRIHCPVTKFLTIVAQGNMKLQENTASNISTDITGRVLIITNSTEINERLLFKVNTHESSTLAFDIHLTDLSLSQVPNNPANNNFLINLSTRYGDEISFKISGKTGNPRFLSGPTVTIFNAKNEPNGNLLVHTSGSVQVFHFPGCQSYQGIQGLANYFKLTGNCWNVNGATNSTNIFILEIDEKGSINETSFTGGIGSSENTLIVEQLSADNAITFNFHRKWFGTSPGQNAKMDNIQQFYGRISKPDIIVTSCDASVTMIDGRGGASSGTEGKDKIFIDDNNRSCEILVLVPEFTEVRNTARHGRFVYDISLESGLDCIKFYPYHENQHVLQYRFLPAGIISEAVYEEAKHLLQLNFSFNESLKFDAIRLGTSLNPTIRFVNSDQGVTCEFKAAESDGEEAKLNAIWEIKYISNTLILHGLTTSINTFVVNITQNFDEQSRFEFHGGIGAEILNEFWIASVPSKINVISGQDNDYGTNVVRLLDTLCPDEDLIIDLHDTNGSISATSGPVVEKMTDIHKFFGRVNHKDTVIPGCNTEQISAAEEIVIYPDYCHWFYLDVTLQPGTVVSFFMPIENEDIEITEAEGEFRYHFQEPMSFTPLISRKYHNQFLHTEHIYHLPLTLSDLDSINFYIWNDTVTYSIGDSHYFHEMLVILDEEDEFYRQPKFFTRDACEVRVGRSGEILAICTPNSQTGVLDESMVAKIAVDLGITIIYKTKDFVIQAGNDKEEERNVLTTSKNATNHFYGGGGANTIYEIVFLQHDLVINTGVPTITNVTEDQRLIHTLDLTDIIVPLRAQIGTKYVPPVRREGDDLIISLPEYESLLPGEITLVNGVYIADIFQILLNSAVMGLKTVDESNNTTELPGSRIKQGADTITDRWVIYPKPILIEPGTVYSISQEDLEDGHKISLGEDPKTETRSNFSFLMAKSEDDLVFSNIMSNDGEEPTIIIISGFYPSTSNNSLVNTTQQNETFASNIAIELPGMEKFLDKSVHDLTYEAEEDVTTSWDDILEVVEEALLEEMPEIPRTFKRNTNLFPVWFFIIALALLAIIAIATVSTIFVVIKRKLCWSSELYFGPETGDDTVSTKENDIYLIEVKPLMKMVQDE